jgi:hypothetical protein
MSLVLKRPGTLSTLLENIFSWKITREKTAVTTRSLTDNITIFLTIDQNTIGDHFNPNDPAPIYKRQLSHQFQHYILTSIESARRYSTFYYKITCKTKNDKQYADAFVYAVRRHFSAKKLIQIERFEKFKKRSYILLLASLLFMMVCHVLVPMIVSDDDSIMSALHNGLDIFSWVILWQPIDKLVFQWNPYLRDISIMHRLVNAEVIITDNV